MLESAVKKKDLLLHVCCGVCAIRVIEKLLPDYSITGYFYNPNIEPPDEYQKRLEANQIVFNYYHLKLINGAFENALWHDAIIGLEHWAEGGPRCRRCFQLRLEKTAYKAAELRLSYYATTLIVNPHKDKVCIDKWGQYYADLFKIGYLPIELTNAQRYDLVLAKKLGIYRQKYCGCAYSTPDLI